MSVLDWGPVSRIRRNHALEHATLQILSARRTGYRLAGYSDMGGFWLVGSVATEEIASAVQEALRRLENGERHLAVHPNCGTNFVTAGVVAGALAWLGMLGADSSWKKRLDRLPFLMSLVTVALIIAQPLGPLLQARVTTAAEPRGMRVVRISLEMRGGAQIHRIVTQA